MNANAIALALAFAGLAAMVASTGGRAWPLALSWVVAAAGFSWGWRTLASRRVRMAVGVAAAGILVLLAWEGGLFLLPALVALLALTARRGI